MSAQVAEYYRRSTAGDFVVGNRSHPGSGRPYPGRRRRNGQGAPDTDYDEAVWCAEQRHGGGPIAPGCYRGGAALCDLQMVGGSVQAVAATTAFNLTVQPTITPWFEGLAMLAVVEETATPTTNRRVRFTSASVGGSPQWNIDTPAPVAGTLAVILSDSFNFMDYPLPISFAVFSNAANTNELIFSGFNHNAVAVTIYISVWGNGLRNLPTDLGGPQVITSGRPGYGPVG